MPANNLKVTFSIIRIMLFSFFLQWPFISFANREARAIKKVGRHFEKIYKVNYKYSLMRSGADMAANDMYKEVKSIHKLYKFISDTAAIKMPLKQFLDKWNTQERIKSSVLNGKQEFMADANSFYMQGFVKRRSESKTLFPLFRP